MKRMPIVFLGIVFLFFHTIAYASVTNEINASSTGGNSSVKVQVNNQINTGNSSTTTTTGKTNVEIHQAGSGTSSVTVNGKEWKVEGPGDISVQEGSDATRTQTPDASPSASPSSTDSVQETHGFVESLKENLENLKEALQSFVSFIFGKK